jgi:hypothetical protein
MIGSHFSDWEIDERLIQAGERDFKNADNEEASRHLAECEPCASRPAALHEVLSLYREEYLRESNQSLIEHPIRRSRTKRPGPADRVRIFASRVLSPKEWGWAVALVLLIAAMAPTIILHRRAVREEQIARDNLLLQQIDQEVSESVPNPLQSLSNLVVADESLQR